MCILPRQETVSGSGISWAICRSAPCCRQITIQFFTGRMPFLSPNQQRQSTEGEVFKQRKGMLYYIKVDAEVVRVVTAALMSRAAPVYCKIYSCCRRLSALPDILISHTCCAPVISDTTRSQQTWITLCFKKFRTLPYLQITSTIIGQYR